MCPYGLCAYGGLSKVAYKVARFRLSWKHSCERARERQRETEKGSTRVITEQGTTVRYEPRPACTFEPSTYSSGTGEGNRVGKDVGGGMRRGGTSPFTVYWGPFKTTNNHILTQRFISRDRTLQGCRKQCRALRVVFSDVSKSTLLTNNGLNAVLGPLVVGPDRGLSPGWASE